LDHETSAEECVGDFIDRIPPSPVDDFTGISSIVDIGGGKGELLRKISDLNPEMRGAVLDMPTTIEAANQHFSDDRCGGDARTSQEISSNRFHEEPDA
jgi:hypothetical protein